MKITIAAAGRYEKAKLGVGYACVRVCRIKEILQQVLIIVAVFNGR